MVSKPLTRAQLIDQGESVLQDSTNTVWTAAELGLLLDDILEEVSHAVPFLMRDIYQIESRTGKSTSTSSNNLVDADESQFASGDTKKAVYNRTDKTWAVIESFTSATTVALSKDIFTVGEEYEIYNKGCWNKRQINIEDSAGFLWIPEKFGVAYPVNPDYHTSQHHRNFTLLNQDEILEIDTSWIDDSKNTDADKDIYVYFCRHHLVNPMTDLAGAVNLGAGYAAGDTSMVLDALQASGTVFKDTLFTVALASGIDSRLTYRVTADASITTNAATISFWPGLEAAVSDNAVVTFTGSTLSPELERVTVELLVARALQSKSISKTDDISVGGTGVWQRYQQLAAEREAKVQRKLKAMIDVELRASYLHSRS